VELLRDASHVRNWRLSEWRRLFAEAGFTSEVLLETTIPLEGDPWVTRSQTPPERVAAIKTLFAGASAAARAAFHLRLGEGWGWSIPAALVRGVLPE
jgi:hypothetical protein